jgi:hypothetical protein
MHDLYVEPCRRSADLVVNAEGTPAEAAEMVITARGAPSSSVRKTRMAAHGRKCLTRERRELWHSNPMHKTDKPWGTSCSGRTHAGLRREAPAHQAGHQLSLQYHERKEETILVYSGRMLFPDRGRGRRAARDTISTPAWRITSRSAASTA